MDIVWPGRNQQEIDMGWSVNRNWQMNYYPHDGHYHRLVDHLMVNPFTNEKLPDQWCQGNKPTVEQPTIHENQIKEIKLMSAALWCDVGNHAFSSLDMDMEEGTRTRTTRNRDGYPVKITVETHVCGQHRNPFPSQADKPSIKNRTAADDFDDEYDQRNGNQ